MNYQFECECGRSIAVELFHAGMSVDCSNCGQPNVVPSASRLKEMSGDRHPHLSSLDKVVRTLELGEPPFDGQWHSCNVNRAEYTTPIQFDVMQERYEQGESGVRPTLTGIELYAAPTEECWRRVTFPLLLCESCQHRFGESRRRTNSLCKSVIVALASVLVVLFAIPVLIVAAMICAPVVAAFAMVMWHRDSRKGALYVRPWLADIRFVSEAIECESEYKLHVGSSQPLPLHS